MDSTYCEHDLRNKDLAKRHVANKILAEKARKHITATNSTLGERTAVIAIWTAMKAKTKIGMGLKTKKKLTKKRILSVAKRSGFLFYCFWESSARWRCGRNCKSNKQ